VAESNSAVNYGTFHFIDIQVRSGRHQKLVSAINVSTNALLWL